MPLSSFKIPKRESTGFPPVPEDIYQVEVYDIIALQKPAYKKPDVMETVLKFQFTILEDGEFQDKEGKTQKLRCRNIWRDYVPAALWSSKKNGKNVLWQIIEAVIMRELTPAEVDSMDSEFLNKIIGYQCRIVIKNTKDDDGKVWNNIDSFLPKKGSLPSLTAEEREQVKVKPREGDEEVTDEVLARTQQTQGYTPDNPAYEELPTINLDETPITPEAPAEPAAPSKDEKELKIEDVPF